MFRTIIWYLDFAISLFLQTPKLLKANKLVKAGRLEERDAYVHAVTSAWALKRLKHSGATVHIYGAENLPKDYNAVFISNHQSNFDIALFMSHVATPKGFVSKAEMAKVPLLKQWMEHIHCIFMDRSTLKGAASAIVEGIKVIKEGHSLVIFPEGTRSQCDKMGEFKAGSFKLATKPKVPIIPVTINGSYRLMEGNGGKVKPATVELYIHPAIETAGLSKEELNALPETVQSIIASKLPHTL